MSEKEEMLKRKREEEARARRILEEDLANDGKPRVPRKSKFVSRIGLLLADEKYCVFLNKARKDEGHIQDMILFSRTVTVICQTIVGQPVQRLQQLVWAWPGSVDLALLPRTAKGAQKKMGAVERKLKRKRRKLKLVGECLHLNLQSQKRRRYKKW